MTPERVAHARGTLSQDWDYPKRVVTKDNVRMLLDAIESAWQERDAARAALSAMTAERDKAINERNAYAAGERERTAEADALRAQLAARGVVGRELEMAQRALAQLVQREREAYAEIQRGLLILHRAPALTPAPVSDCGPGDNTNDKEAERAEA